MKGKWTVTPRVGVEVSQEKSDEIASKLNDGRDVEIAARSLSGVFKWSEQPEGVHYWAIADDLVTIEYVTEPEDEKASSVLEKMESLATGNGALPTAKGHLTMKEIRQFIADYRILKQRAEKAERRVAELMN